MIIKSCIHSVLSFTCQGLRGSPLLLVFHDLGEQKPALPKVIRKNPNDFVFLHLFFWEGNSILSTSDNKCMIEIPNNKAFTSRFSNLGFCTVKARLPFARQVTCPHKEASPKSTDINSSTNQPSSSHTPQTKKKMLTSISKF